MSRVANTSASLKFWHERKTAKTISNKNGYSRRNQPTGTRDLGQEEQGLNLVRKSRELAFNM